MEAILIDTTLYSVHVIEKRGKMSQIYIPFCLFSRGMAFVAANMSLLLNREMLIPQILSVLFIVFAIPSAAF